MPVSNNVKTYCTHVKWHLFNIFRFDWTNAWELVKTTFNKNMVLALEQIFYNNNKTFSPGFNENMENAKMKSGATIDAYLVRSYICGYDFFVWTSWIINDYKKVSCSRYQEKQWKVLSNLFEIEILVMVGW